MTLSDLISVCGFVNITCYVWRDGKFHQWEPKYYTHGLHKYDQTGKQLRDMKAPILEMRVHNVLPTAYNFMNVYLY